MEEIFSYLDYRQLLRKRFSQLKKSRRGVTHRSLAKLAGFSSPNFLQLVMNGKRNLSNGSAPKVSRAFGFEGKTADFFIQLVAFNQAKNLEEKDQAYQRMKNLRSDLPLKRIEHSQFEYFDHWYVSAIRELAGLKDFQENAKWIRSRLQGKVSLPQIKKSLQLLERLGFLKRNPEGELVSSEAVLTTGDEVASLGIYRYHTTMLKMAQEAIQKNSPEHRDISALTVSVSREKFLTLKQKIQNFRKEILALAQDIPEADAVYQMNIQLFPLTELLWKN